MARLDNMQNWNLFWKEHFYEKMHILEYFYFHIKTQRMTQLKELLCLDNVLAVLIIV
jgi:hypothetical protein